jgi:hypothetical protein
MRQSLGGVPVGLQARPELRPCLHRVRPLRSAAHLPPRKKGAPEVSKGLRLRWNLASGIVGLKRPPPHEPRLPCAVFSQLLRCLLSS